MGPYGPGNYAQGPNGTFHAYKTKQREAPHSYDSIINYLRVYARRRNVLHAS